MSAAPRPHNDRLPTETPAHGAGTTRVIVSSLALAGLVVLGTVGVVLGGKPAPAELPFENVATSADSPTSPAPSAGTSGTSGTSDTSPTSPAPPPPPSPMDKLVAALPPGYNPTNCHPATTAPAAIATVDCDELQSGGPTSAHFSLFPDVNALASQFQIGVNEAVASDCPGEIESPRSWHYASTPAFSAGSLLCGTRNEVPDLMWTKNDVLLLGNVQGADLDSLYGWWLSLG